MVGLLNDWQEEWSSNNQKEGCGVQVIRDGIKRVVDVHQVDIALLEPGEIILCAGVFLSGHNVKCDESGTTGESNAIGKVSYGKGKQRSVLPAQIRRLVH